jgi:outer membrane protein TolC
MVSLIVGMLTLPQTGWADGGIPSLDSGAADLADLIAIARAMSPDLAAAALASDAAAAKVQGADSLPDPKLIWQPMDIPRGNSTILPSRLPRTDKVFLQQEFPLWGKRDLKREIAEADAKKAARLRQVAENELVARVKAAYAEYHQLHQAMALDQELLPRLTTLAQLATARYAQGVGGQQEATGAEVERAQLQADLANLEADRHKAKARLNTLLGRAADAPLAETPYLRPIPAEIDLSVLSDTAQRLNPDLQVQDANIASADKSTALAKKSWYPDIGVSVGGVKANGRFDGYEAMLEVNIPLRGDLRDADIGEAKAMAAAARARRHAKELEIENMLNDAYWSLEAAQKTEKLIAEDSLPQAKIGFESAAHAYQLGKGEFIMVLTAEQQWRKTHLDQLKAQLEQQIRLAELEKLAGGDL